MCLTSTCGRGLYKFLAGRAAALMSYHAFRSDSLKDALEPAIDVCDTGRVFISHLSHDLKLSG